MAKMKLLRFCVESFRSVKDSGWIETGDITSLIGTNESGKTNILLPLWKLNPARDGEIDPIADYPRTEYNAIREMSDADKPVFIRAEFQLSDGLADRIVSLTRASKEEVSVVQVARDFAGARFVTFPNATAATTVKRTSVASVLEQLRSRLAAAPSGGDLEDTHKKKVTDALNGLLAEIGGLEDMARADVEKVRKACAALSPKELPESAAAAELKTALNELGVILKDFSRPSPDDSEEATAAILEAMPKFVYYSTYGNLDSEIYLPHVIENLARTDLGTKEAAKARTLKVLFEFVRLDPKEILELGQDLDATKTKPTADQIQETARRKKEREILLQSASTSLTESFRDWWKQGQYRIRFQADGAHFRIWVADDVRPEEIELEGRSTGLQWFLSFYLIFLNEAAKQHADAILLLDEPGLSLHPLAQKDLSKFFVNLASTNQIAFTTHSPFLIDWDHLDQVKAVYIDEKGRTAVSADLRAAQTSPQARSIYAVHAALGLSVSEALLQGCRPIIVEGTSDQILLSAIKTFLIGAGKLKPKREMVFMPAGGVRGVKPIVSIMSGKDEDLPWVLLDADKAGVDMTMSLRSALYSGEAGARVLSVLNFASVPNAELEDMVSPAIFAATVDRLLRGPADYPFADAVIPGQPVVPQVEAYATKHGLPLALGWKVEVAKTIKTRILKSGSAAEFAADIANWEKLFTKLND